MEDPSSFFTTFFGEEWDTDCASFPTTVAEGASSSSSGMGSPSTELMLTSAGLQYPPRTFGESPQTTHESTPPLDESSILYNLAIHLQKSAIGLGSTSIHSCIAFASFADMYLQPTRCFVTMRCSSRNMLPTDESLMKQHPFLSAMQQRHLISTGLTERLQAICPSIDGPQRDVYRLPGIEPLELLLAIPHRIAAGPTEAWVR